MAEEPPLCAACGEEVPQGEGLTCYLCGALFHFSREQICGSALSQALAC